MFDESVNKQVRENSSRQIPIYHELNIKAHAENMPLR